MAAAPKATCSALLEGMESNKDKEKNEQGSQSGQAISAANAVYLAETPQRQTEGRWNPEKELHLRK